MKTDAAAPAEATAKGAALAAGMRGVVRVGYRGPRVIRKTSRLEAVANCTVAALRRPEGAPDSPRTTAARSLYCIARCIQIAAERLQATTLKGPKGTTVSRVVSELRGK